MRRRGGQGPHLAKRWEPRGFSRVAAGFSSYDGDLSFPLRWPWEAQSSPRVARRPSSKAGRGGVDCQDPQRCSEETRARKVRLHGLAQLRWGRRPVSGPGLLSRPCRKRRPSAREDGGVSGVSSSCGARGGFLQLPEFTQTHVHRVSDVIQPSHPLSSPSPPAPNPSQHQSLFQ